MTTEKTHGLWVEWHGGKCPVPLDTLVRVKLRCGHVCDEPCRPGNYFWDHKDGENDIISYRIATEQPDLEAAEKLLLAYGYTVTQPAKALTFEDVTPMTKAPPEGTEYWVVQPVRETGVESYCWAGDDFDECALRHRMAYRNQEHALIAARHIFGLKGGEL